MSLADLNILKESNALYKNQAVIYKRLWEITEEQLANQIKLTTALENKSTIQENLIKSLDDTNNRYAEMVKERDALIQEAIRK